MEIPIDYHILFLVMSFVLFILTIFLLFIEVTFQKAIAANILIMFSIIINFIVAYGFSAIDLYSWDSSGNVVHNVYSNMHPFIQIYWAFVWINISMIFYCVYIYLKKPWIDYTKNSRDDFYEEGEYYGQEYWPT